MIKDYRKLIILPVFLIVFCLVIIGSNYSKTGEIVEKSIDFEGGTQVSIFTESEINFNLLEESVLSKIDSTTTVRLAKGDEGQTIIIESKRNIDLGDIKGILDNLEISYNEKNISRSSIGATLGGSFFRDAEKAVVVAFILMSLVVFLVFKSPVPCVAIISAAMVDMLGALTAMVLLKIELSLATLAALLMLLGYSVDTDILLTTRVLKRVEEGTLDERVLSSMKTGITMSITSIASFSVLYLIPTSYVLNQMAVILIVGLIVDLITTWFQNVAILRWYLGRAK